MKEIADIRADYNDRINNVRVESDKREKEVKENAQKAEKELRESSQKSEKELKTTYETRERDLREIFYSSDYLLFLPFFIIKQLNFHIKSTCYLSQLAYPIWKCFTDLS